MGEALVATTGALLGVVVGAALTYVFTVRAQVAKSLHDTRIAAYARFASAVMEYRRALMERWFLENGAQQATPDGHRVYDARAAAWGALFEVQLLTADPRIAELAREAIDATSAIKEADGHGVLVQRADESRTRVESFISSARGDVAAGSSVT